MQGEVNRREKGYPNPDAVVLGVGQLSMWYGGITGSIYAFMPDAIDTNRLCLAKNHGCINVPTVCG
jgi:hypothetical protein